MVIVEEPRAFLDWHKYVQTYERELPVIVEECLVGQEVSVETWSVNGEVQVLAVVDKMTTKPPYCVEVGHTTPSRLPAEQVDQLKDAATRIVRALEIENGPVHNELYMTKDGPKFVETGARLGGGCIASHLVPLSTGIDLVEASLDFAMGNAPDLTPKLSAGAALRFLQPSPGTVRANEGLERAREMDGVVDVSCNLEPGSLVKHLQNSDQRVGYVIAQGKDADDAARNCDAALAAITIDVDPR